MIYLLGLPGVLLIAIGIYDISRIQMDSRTGIVLSFLEIFSGVAVLVIAAVYYSIKEH